jgi:ribonuclease HI
MLIANFDGSCNPNPGGVCSYGFVIWRDATRLHEGHGPAAPRGPGATNNVAEYTGCIKALEWVLANGIDEPFVLRGDSELVLKQLKGEYKVKSPLLAPLYWRARELCGKVRSLRFEWVPREQNAEADRLASLG